MKKFYIALPFLLCFSGILAQEASYEHPTALRYVGTITDTDPTPVASLTTQNPVNNGAFLWIPAEKSVKYIDSSTGVPSAWNWSADGGVIEDASSRNAIVRYNSVGTYDFPKLTVDYPSGTSEYQPDLKLKVGGVAELCLADCREWAVTYGLGTNFYDQDFGATNGCLGGTNKLDIAGVGNFYMMSLEEGFLDGVNVYLNTKPTRWKEGAKIRIRAWMSLLGENDIQFTGYPLEGGYVDFEDIKTADDGVWVPVKNGAVIQMRFDNPVELYGKQLIFIDVDGWSNDPATEDFHMLMDVMPNRTMAPEDASNKLAHNSFVRLSGESDYLRPVSYFGGNYGSFMICPVVRGGETPVGSVSQIDVADIPAMRYRMEGGAVVLSGADGRFEVFNIGGMLCHSGEIAGGTAEIPASTLVPGIYVARNAFGQTVKFVVK